MLTISLDHLRLAVYDFTLHIAEPLTLPAYKGAALRGGFGITFKRSVCVYSNLPPCESCLLRQNCAYPAIFEPSPPPNAEVLRNHTDVPLPFIIEPPPDQRTHYAAGDSLRFRVVLIGQAINALPYFIVVFQRLGEIGLGAERARYTLDEVAFYDARNSNRTVLLQQGRLMHNAREHSLSVSDLTAPHVQQAPVSLTLTFQTPTRLKYADDFLHTAPPFHVIIRTLLRRLSSLSYFHGGQRWDTDYRGWIERAEQVSIAHADVQWVDWERYSTRQERRMNLGGIIGQVTYAGDVTPFVPLLRLAESIHLGKGAVFGNGQVRLQIAASAQAGKTSNN